MVAGEALMASIMFARISLRALLACASASSKISFVMPLTLMSICMAVMPCCVPATLKSMSPK